MSSRDQQFHDFLLAEYSHIADAHFKTNEAVSNLFKQYFAIAAIPISTLVVAVSLEPTKSILTSTPLLSFLLVSLLFLLISFIGFFVLVHMSNLNFDAILYARTINALRKYYYDRSESVNNELENRMRTLPKSPMMPRYHEGIRTGFVPFLVTVSMVNSVYFGLGLFGLLSACSSNTSIADRVTVVGLLAGLFFTSHIIAYLSLAKFRETSYLRSNIIGVDIDGVLNCQSPHFCDYLQRQTGKHIRPEQITTIPVHNCAALGISTDDERSVFNDPRYWMEMPAVDGASEAVAELRKSMNFKVHIFTNRRWPSYASGTTPNNSQWSISPFVFEQNVLAGIPLHRRVRFSFRGPRLKLWPYGWRSVKELMTSDASIDRITKSWLESHGFDYDALMIEKASGVVADPALTVRNRFYACRSLAIKYFIEDDLVNANKLAHICDVVFLIDQPYNQSTTVPKNVIRVSGWTEILANMRQLS